MNELGERIAKIAKKEISEGRLDLEEELDYDKLVQEEEIPGIERVICDLYQVNKETARLMLARTMKSRSPHTRLYRKGKIDHREYVNRIRNVEFEVCAEFGVLPVHSDHYLKKFGVELEERRFPNDS